MRATVVTLLVAALTTSPASDAAPYAPRCHFACARQCDWERCYDRCMHRCLKESSRRSRPRRVPQTERHTRGQFVELILPFLAERVGPGVVMVGSALGLIVWAIRRRHNLRIAEERTLEANALEHKAADLRAEADRLKNDL
jgi:hypothetical protein